MARVQKCLILFALFIGTVTGEGLRGLGSNKYCPSGYKPIKDKEFSCIDKKCKPDNKIKPSRCLRIKEGEIKEVITEDGKLTLVECNTCDLSFEDLFKNLNKKKCPEEFPNKKSNSCIKECEDLPKNCADIIDAPVETFSFVNEKKPFELIGCPKCSDSETDDVDDVTDDDTNGFSDDCPDEYPIQVASGHCKQDCDVELPINCIFVSAKRHLSFDKSKGLTLEKCPKCLKEMKLEQNGCPNDHPVKVSPNVCKRENCHPPSSNCKIVKSPVRHKIIFQTSRPDLITEGCASCHHADTAHF